MRKHGRQTRRRKGGSMDAEPPHCQCRGQDGMPCGHIAIQKTPFCAQHQNCSALPMNGYEPAYYPERYNKDPAIYKSHNCYSYSMNVVDPKKVDLCKKNNNNTDDCRANFHQPGAKNGERNALNVEERRKCGVVERLMISDVPQIEKSGWNAVCPMGKSKIALVVSKGKDYHFYRQDNNGRWSHKDGSNKVKTFDALGQPIADPQLASRDYRPKGSDLNYEDFCGFYCVPRDQPVELEQVGATQQGGHRLPVMTGLSWTDWPSPAELRARRARTRRLLAEAKARRRTYRRHRR